jgi:pyruvate dehydrogenase E1 component alpha subunit
MNVEAIHEAVSRAADRARKGDGPTYLEFRTYRFRGHSMSDPQKYRTKEEVAEYKKRDPIAQVMDTILKNKFATEDELAEMDKKIKEIVAKSVEFAEESPYPDAKEAYTNVYMQEDYPFVAE